MRILKNKKAFSIIEVIVSMTILAILIAGLSSSLSILLDVNLNNSLRVQINNNLDLLSDQLQKDIGAAEYIYTCDNDQKITTQVVENAKFNCLRFVYNGKQFTWSYDAAKSRLVKRIANGTTVAEFLDPAEKDSSDSAMTIKTTNPFEVKIYTIIDPIDNKIYNDVSVILNIVVDSSYKKTDGITPRVAGIFRQTILGTKNISN